MNLELGDIVKVNDREAIVLEKDPNGFMVRYLAGDQHFQVVPADECEMIASATPKKAE